MKKYKVFIVILVILIILVAVFMGLYIFKKDTIKTWLSKNTENNIIEEEPKQEKQKTELNKIVTLGTGMKRPSNYKPTDSYYVAEYTVELEELVNNLKDENLKKEINTFIKESKEKLEEEKTSFEKYINEGNERKGKVIVESLNTKLNYYNPQIENCYTRGLNLYEERKNKIGITTDWKCVNGYLSIAFYYKYHYGDIEDFIGDILQSSGVYKVYSATYDLYTGKKIKFSDLFFEGEDYSTELYELMQSKIATEKYASYIKRDFTTLPQDYEYFTLNSIFFNKQNTYFSEGAIIPTDYCYTMFPVITIGRDMKGIFTDKIEIREEFSTFKFRYQTIQTEIAGVPYKIPKIKHWDNKIGEKINNNLEKYIKYIMENYKEILDTWKHASGTYMGNTVHLSHDEDDNIKYIVYYKSAYPIIEILVNKYTGELKGVEPIIAMYSINSGSKSFSKMLEEMKDL